MFSLPKNSSIPWTKKKKGRVGFMAIKLDLEKAYDRLEWSFVHRVLQAFHFPPKLTKIIMSCIATISTSILVDGGALQSFEPSRSIKQGDPLSPYILYYAWSIWAT